MAFLVDFSPSSDDEAADDALASPNASTAPPPLRLPEHDARLVRRNISSFSSSSPSSSSACPAFPALPKTPDKKPSNMIGLGLDLPLPLPPGKAMAVSTPPEEPLQALSTPSPMGGSSSLRALAPSPTDLSHYFPGAIATPATAKAMATSTLTSTNTTTTTTTTSWPSALIFDDVSASSSSVRHARKLSNINASSLASSTASRPSSDLVFETKRFPYHQTDYAILHNRKLGSGAWCTVYLAQPTSTAAEQNTITTAAASSLITPPHTPTMRRDSTLFSIAAGGSPPMYAVKIPSSTTARSVLNAEAAILSYLNALPDADQHVVPFHGQDTRNDSLVLDALPLTLEAYIDQLNLLPESERCEEMAAIFPLFAQQCVRGLAFLHAAGVVHADIKPSNILLRPCPLGRRTPNRRPIYQPLFADFSSSLCPASVLSNTKAASSSSPSKPYVPLGGGTWDFLAPSLLNPRSPTLPIPQTDVHALSITLLCLITGHSPFDIAGGNHFMRREMIKQGQAFNCISQDDEANARLRTLEAKLHWIRGNVQEWLEEGLWERGPFGDGTGMEASRWLTLLKERI